MFIITYSAGELNDSRLDIATPCINSSVSTGRLPYEARIGDATQSGGPIVDEYPGCTMLSFVGVISASLRREKVSATTFLLPAT